ncbi:3-hydroxybutyryl-CoA epimerase [Acidianus sulfidivorans JP7]|uniref:3-hydroxybutyryl-CoA epimerase n=1 Tax=Acidianus sulfidivorans JP7 TaxID=619593 RepID=A0A2U9ILL2_9CREN|nr:Zn-ribbon domain-containing OB-fold protein [Acidianus sulfidivorans]AWR96907.1 3-hydroxybutyryl-CoA epimerase [Acidianus sulfidivorans JP7]
MWEDKRQIVLKYHIPDDRIHYFFEQLEKGKVLYTRCPKCGTAYFPPRQDCAKCKISNLDWEEIKSEGELLAYTIIYVKPESFSKYPDYIIGVAKFPEGFNVLAWIKSNKGELKVGSKVNIKVEKMKNEGNNEYDYIYYLELNNSKY